MAPQTDIPPAANILGTIGTVLWCIQLIPQIWHNYKLKKTEGMPGSMMLLWALAAVPFGVYAVVQNLNIPIQIQPQVFGTLALITWAQILIYYHGWPVCKAVVLTGGLFVVFAGIEIALILTLRGPYKRGLNWPITLDGSIAAVLLSTGVLPPYLEIWRRCGRVIGINWIFLSLDTLGAIFSLLAIVVQNTFDALGGVIYIVVIVLEGGIYLSHIIWRLRTRKLRQRANLEGKNFDDLPEARRYQYDSKDKKHRCSNSSDLEKEDASVNMIPTSGATPVHATLPNDSEPK